MTFGEETYNLFLGGDITELNIGSAKMLSDKVTVDFNMLRSFMKYIIECKFLVTLTISVKWSRF